MNEAQGHTARLNDRARGVKRVGNPGHKHRPDPGQRRGSPAERASRSSATPQCPQAGAEQAGHDDRLIRSREHGQTRDQTPAPAVRRGGRLGRAGTEVQSEHEQEQAKRQRSLQTTRGVHHLMGVQNEER
jgi:hypothetical protein